MWLIIVYEIDTCGSTNATKILGNCWESADSYMYNNPASRKYIK